MRLYDSIPPSGNVYKVSLLCAQLGRVHELVELDLTTTPPATRRPEFLSKNPVGRVPVLELDDGTCLAESNAILLYLAEGTRFLAAEPIARARSHGWLFFEQNLHEPYVAVLKYWTYWGGLDRLGAGVIDHLTRRGQAALDTMADHLARHDFFVGDYGVADIALFAYTQSAAEVGFVVPAAVARWLDRVRAQPGYRPMKPDATDKAPTPR